MDAEMIWNLFQQTGSPELYLLYRRIRSETKPSE